MQGNAYSVFNQMWEHVIFCTNEYVQEWVNCVGSMCKNRECDVWTVCKQQFVFSCNDTLPCYDAQSAIHKLYDDTCFDNDDMMHAIWHSSMHHDVYFLHAHYMLMMMVGIW